MGEKLSNIQAARSDLVLAIAKSFFQSIFFVGLTMDDESWFMMVGIFRVRGHATTYRKWLYMLSDPLNLFIGCVIYHSKAYHP